jgi:hypothetical protein
MPNSIEKLTFVATEMLRQVKNNLQFVKNLDGEDLTSRFTQMPKVGESFTIRKPARYVGRTGETYTPEDYIERTIPIAVQTTDGVDITLSNRELMFSLDQLKERVVNPAAVTLANIIDGKALQMASQATYNAVGTPATVPAALKTYNQARAKISYAAAPNDNHTLLITPDMHVEAVDAGKSFFNPTAALSNQYERGLIQGSHYGAKVYEIQDYYTHTVGPLGGAPAVSGGGQTGASLLTSGWTAAAAARLKKGDIFTIANVYAVNPLTRKSTGALAQFTVTADFSSAADGTGTVSISPAIVVTGPYQNVNAGPAGGALITVLGAANAVSPVGLRFQKESFIFGMCKQPEPGGVEFVKSLVDEQTGISLRFIRDWDTTNNKQLNRIDAVWAFGVAFPEWSCRIHS